MNAHHAANGRPDLLPLISWFSSTMRLVLVAMAVGGVAFADAPNGRYRLAVEQGWQQILGPTKDRVPSCGRRAADFIAHFGPVNIEVANDVAVNGTVWKPGPSTADRRSVVNDQLLEGFALQITFYRERTAAKGMLVVVGLSNEVIRCGDGLRLEGQYGR